ncbi:MAG: glycosyltransferase [Candidatus Aenigmarchaeota archaeon]|nr:glycosyltransferase [Candidatus Aenigmarchaeota archaeon]
MKVLYIIPNEKVGGAGTYANNLLKNIKVDKDFVKINEIFSIKEVFLKSFSKINNDDFDIIHSVYELPTFLSLFTKKPLVSNMHGTYALHYLDKSKLKYFMRLAYKKANLISISDYTRDQLLKRDIKKVKVVYGGVDYKYWSKRDENDYLKEKYGKGLFMLTVGAIKRRKGHHILYEAFLKLKEDYPNLRWVVCGKKYDDIIGPHKDIIYEKPNNETLRKIYHSSDFFAMTSINYKGHFEGFGLVFLEAMASGIPVIGSDSGGVPSAIPKKCGWLAKEGNIDDTIKIIKQMLENDTIRKQKIKNAKEWAKKLDWKNIAKQVKKYYEEVLNSV